MSVLVKGWTIPKGCADCPTWCKLYLQRREFRHPDCPLIEVPTPHGDLVDRTELLAEYDRQHKGPAGGARRIMEQATAIIKAEESE